MDALLKRFYILILILCFSLAFLQQSRGQNFTVDELSGGSFISTATLLDDYDADGDLDIILTRRTFGGADGLEWLENDGTGQFPRRPLYEDDNLSIPGDIATCDCNNDGITDYVVTEPGPDGQLFWLQRLEDDTYIKWTLDADIGYDQAVVADFDGDGDDDVAAVGFHLEAVNLFRNEGAFNFAKITLPGSISQSELIFAEDFDNDGDVDLVTDGTNRGLLFYNEGNGIFTVGPELDITAFGLFVADVNNDSVNDILTYNSMGGQAGLYFLDGANNFLPQFVQTFSSLVDIGGDLVAADFDGNGFIDIVRQNLWGSSLNIVYQDDELVFRTELLDANRMGKLGSSHMVTGDLDLDGDIDLVIPENDGDVSWYENIDGRLYRHQPYAEVRSPRIPKIGDIDGDGDPDIVVAIPLLSGENEIVWYENRGASGFIDWLITDQIGSSYDLELADFDGDGLLDIASTVQDSNDVVWLKRVGDDWEITRVDSNLNGPEGLAVADVDRNGTNDIIVASTQDDKVYWFSNNGSGGFVRLIVDPNFPLPSEVDAGDFDGNGTIDIVAISNDEMHSVTLFRADGSQNFTRETLITGRTPSDLEVGDWNGDRHLDIVVAYYESSTAEADVDVFINDGTDSFTSSTLVSSIRRATSVKLVDVDNDSDLDIVTGEEATSSMGIGYNQGGVSVDFQKPYEPFSSATFIQGVDAADLDGDGLVDIVATDDQQNRMLLFRQENPTNVSIEELSVERIHDQAILAQNYPNPFKHRTHITFTIDFDGEVSLVVFDIMAREIARLIDERMYAGSHSVIWDANDLASGTYLYRLSINGRVVTKKLSLVR